MDPTGAAGTPQLPQAPPAPGQAPEEQLPPAVLLPQLALYTLYTMQLQTAALQSQINRVQAQQAAAQGEPVPPAVNPYELVAQAVDTYFTNGASVVTGDLMNVPTSGPGAAYFTSGATVTGVAPMSASVLEAGAPVAPTAPTDAGAQDAAVADAMPEAGPAVEMEADAGPDAESDAGIDAAPPAGEEVPPEAGAPPPAPLPPPQEPTIGTGPTPPSPSTPLSGPISTLAAPLLPMPAGTWTAHRTAVDAWLPAILGGAALALAAGIVGFGIGLLRRTASRA